MLIIKGGVCMEQEIILQKYENALDIIKKNEDIKSQYHKHKQNIKIGIILSLIFYILLPVTYFLISTIHSIFSINDISFFFPAIITFVIYSIWFLIRLRKVEYNKELITKLYLKDKK